MVDIDLPEHSALRTDAVRFNLSDRAAATAVFAQLAEHDPVTALVDNIGIVCPALFDEIDPHDFMTMLHLNTPTALLTAQAFVPVMRRFGGGGIVMNTSRVTRGKPARSVCGASKGACSRWRATRRGNWRATGSPSTACQPDPSPRQPSGRIAHPRPLRPATSSPGFPFSEWAPPTTWRTPSAFFRFSVGFRHRSGTFCLRRRHRGLIRRRA